MRNLKLTRAIPAVLILSTSLVSILSTITESQKPQPPVQGWKRILPGQCIPVKICNNIDMMVCMDGGTQLYGKSTPISDCTEIIFHQP